MTTTEFFRPQNPIAAQLPNLGICTRCEQTIRLTKGRKVFKHQRPDEDRGCLGSYIAPATVLEPTFKRWLYAQYKRNDAFTNPLTRAAENGFGHCRYGGHAADMADAGWMTTDELHAEVHARPGMYHDPARTDDCTHDCDELAQAVAAYTALAATS